MDFDQQIQALIENAPQDGSTPDIIKAIAPGLKLLAAQLAHLQYFILTSLDQNLVLTTLGNVDNPDLQKQVIYAFSSLDDASVHSSRSDFSTSVVAVPVPVTHILFQAIAIPQLDSFIFFDQPGHLDAATEVKRQDVQDTIQVYLQQYQSLRRSKSRPIPPDIA